MACWYHAAFLPVLAGDHRGLEQAGAGLTNLLPGHAEPVQDGGGAAVQQPEHETKVADAAVVDEILRALGLEHLVAALGDVRAVLGELGIDEDDLTTEQYTNAVSDRAGFTPTG